MSNAAAPSSWMNKLGSVASAALNTVKGTAKRASNTVGLTTPVNAASPAEAPMNSTASVNSTTSMAGGRRRKTRKMKRGKKGRKGSRRN